MSEPDLIPDALPEEEEVAPPPRRRKKSIFGDPVVRWMAIIAGGLVVLYLVTVAAAALMGFIGSPEPKSRVERDLQYYSRAAMQNPKDTSLWLNYVAALLADKQYRKAQDVIDKATQAIDQQSTQDLTMMQAQLYFDTGEYEQVIKTVDELRKKLKAYYDKAKTSKGSPESKGREINENYYVVLVIKAESQVKLGDEKGALKSLDEFLAHNKTASDVFVRRGDLRAELGDTKGAEADYRAALKYLPDDEDALAGLKKIGASQ